MKIDIYKHTRYICAYLILDIQIHFFDKVLNTEIHEIVKYRYIVKCIQISRGTRKGDKQEKEERDEIYLLDTQCI